VSLGIIRISAKAAGNRRGHTVNRTFNGLVGESVDAQSVGNGGNRPTTHTGDTGSPTEKLFALRTWMKHVPAAIRAELCMRKVPPMS
jgi:hypothetical protein